MCQFWDLGLHIALFIITDHLFQGEFASYGSEFPCSNTLRTLSKCEYFTFDHEHDEIKVSAICTILINYINQVVFLFLYYYLVLMSIAIFCNACFCMIVFLPSKFRKFFFAKYFQYHYPECYAQIAKAVEKLSAKNSDFCFLVYLLSLNMEHSEFLLYLGHNYHIHELHDGFSV